MNSDAPGEPAAAPPLQEDLGRAASHGRRIFLVGSPNVGKSVLFNSLTGSYAIVSNYPGTTVEVSRGSWSAPDKTTWEVLDTPGMYSLRPITDEERVSRELLLKSDGVIVHVVDAKNLPRMLPLTLELSMLERPLVLVCNLMDEADKAGVHLDIQRLSSALGIPVVATVATQNKGIDDLVSAVISNPEPPESPEFEISPKMEEAAAILQKNIPGPASRFWALRHLEKDPLAQEMAPIPSQILEEAAHVLGGKQRNTALSTLMFTALRQRAAGILEEAYVQKQTTGDRLHRVLDSLLMNPWTGLPILAAVLYLGIYQFVGVFGGGFLVDWIEGGLFEGIVNPFLNGLFADHIPLKWLHGLFVGEYGVLTLGLRYSFGIILPIVGTYFLAFSILEDTGYLPRLAMLLDRMFKMIGLNGRAVIPMVIGFGCDTMATIVTRILETKRERIIATFLLALAIPCSAQLGVLLALLAGRPGALLVWAGIVLGVFLLSGTLMARLLPGEKPHFFMELPPLRLPTLRNVWGKTISRMGWYLMEVIPIFLIASVLIWLGQITGLFGGILRALAPVVAFIGLPVEAAEPFLFGFFRRDYGAAGLYDLEKAGLLTGVQLVVASVTLTLFLPCIAQFLIMVKERGLRTTLLMSAAVLATAFTVGWILNTTLVGLGVTL